MSAIIILLLALLSFASARPSKKIGGAENRCKAIPGSDDWPLPETWAQLNRTTGGRLIAPTAPGAVCHVGQSVFDAAQCSNVQNSWVDEYFHARDPVSVEWNNWTNDTCLPDPRLPCSGDGYPVYVLNATTSQHVKAGVDFARTHNIRLIIKNSGHDYIGRSSGGMAMSIWIHHMTGYEIHNTSFKPKGCDFEIEGGALTAAAGTQMSDGYKAVAAKNLTVVGGNGRTVALGGYITGGGHSILSPRYGLAVDHVLELEMVTPGGDIIIANECQNTDLFWAMRGGGGSTFGVLTSITMRTFPTPELMSFNFLFATAATNPIGFDAVAYMISQFPILEAAGISGYPVITKGGPNPFDGGRTLITGMMGKLVMLNTKNPMDMWQHLTPLFNHINATYPGFYFWTNTTHYPDFYSWYLENFDNSPVGHEKLVASRLLDEKSLRNMTAVKAAFEGFAGGDQATVMIVSGKGVWEAKPRGGGTSVAPAWRRTVVHAAVGVSFQPVNTTAHAEALSQIQSITEALRKLAPDTGAYMNEGNRYEPHWQETFWGSNYERLLKIKRATDPDDVFWCEPCVGSERWQLVDGRICLSESNPTK